MFNDIMNVIQQRRSVRLFEEKPVSEADLQNVLQAANHAPSAHNQQSWRFIVVSGEKKRELASLVNEKAAGFPKASSALLRMASRSISSSPVVVGVVTTGEMTRHAAGLFTPDQKNAQDFFRTMEIQSSAAAIQNLLLAATALGLSSVWLGILILINEDVLNLFEETEGQLMAVVPLGYNEKMKVMPPKKSLETRVKYFQDPIKY